MRLGDVYSVDLGAPRGHAQAGTRPAIVWQQAVPEGFPTVVVLPLTGKPGARRFQGTVAVRPDGGNGLTQESTALIFQISAIDRRQLVRRLGALSEADRAAVEDALRQFLRLPRAG